MAHIRRKFFDLQAAQGSAVAAQALQQIGLFYVIEEHARGHQIPPCSRATAFSAMTFY